MGRLLAAALGAMFLGQAAVAATPIVGSAAMNEWNVIVFNNFVASNAHVHGRAFIGGNVTGSGNSDFNMDGTSSSRGQPGLTVVGSVQSGGNKVTGGATIGGNVPNGLGFNGPDQVVKVGGTASIANINQNTVKTGLAANPSYLQSLNDQRSALITSMIATSDYLKTLSPTAGVSIADNRATFAAANTNLNVFNVSGGSLGSFGEISFTAAGPTVVNVSGSNILLNDNFLGQSASLGEKVVWNFYEATTLNLTNAFYGTILAPRAKATFNQDLYGTVIVDTLGMGGEAHLQTFSSTLPIPAGVPEPATWAMMIVGFGLVGAQLRRRQAVAAATA